jgi:uncharacterized protein YutE (UPF0331/DUF86 family)
VVDQDLLAAKLAELEDRIMRVRQTCPQTLDALRADRNALEVQSCADIASHLIADEGWPTAVNLASGFNRLRDEGVITPATAAALCRAVGLRNVVAHGYAGVNPAMVHAAAMHGLPDLETFAREVAAWSAQRQDPSLNPPR